MSIIPAEYTLAQIQNQIYKARELGYGLREIRLSQTCYEQIGLSRPWPTDGPAELFGVPVKVGTEGAYYEIHLDDIDLGEGVGE